VPDPRRRSRRGEERLTTLPDTRPIPYRSQNGGDYDEHLLPRPEHASGQEAIHIHCIGSDRAGCDRTSNNTEAAR